MRQPKSRTVRRSIAPSDPADNFKECIARGNEIAFEESMARMASDPAIQAECRRIGSEFATADMDGLNG